MTIENIKVPDIGGGEGVEVIEICVAVGDTVNADDSLVVLESDKASMEVPSPVAGKILAIKLSLGDKVSEGDLILELETEAAVTAAPAATAEVEKPAASVESSPAPQSSSPVAQAAASSIQVVTVPDIGGAEGVDLIEVCVNVGDEVAEGDSLVVLETDKASMEIPSPFAGKVVSIAVAAGAKVSEGDTVMEIETLAVPVSASVKAPASVAAPAASADDISAQETAKSSAPVIAEMPAQAVADPVATAPSDQTIYAGPAVRKLAREFGVTLAKVSGTGPKGRIIKEDLQAFVKTTLAGNATGASGSAIPAIPAVDFSKFGEIELQPLSKLHKLTISNMQRSWLNVPHVTQFDEADITELESFRAGLKKEAEQRNIKLTPLPFIMQACAAALKEHPKFNASLHADGEQMVFKRYVHIGMAVDTPAGLVVPVIRDVDQKSIWQLSAEIAEMADKAKNRKLTPADMQGGCFTISSLGNIGGNGFTPIVNAPEVAILGVSRLAVKPAWDGEQFVPRKMLPLSLSYDHRAVNGADGGRFFTYLASLLSDVRRILL